MRHSLASRVAPLTTDDLFVLAAGGEAGGFSAIGPPWAGGRGSILVTQRVGSLAGDEAGVAGPLSA